MTFRPFADNYQKLQVLLAKIDGVRFEELIVLTETIKGTARLLVAQGEPLLTDLAELSQNSSETGVQVSRALLVYVEKILTALNGLILHSFGNDIFQKSAKTLKQLQFPG